MGGLKSKRVIIFVLLLIILEGGWSEGCLEHERFAILRLKNFFDDLQDGWVDEGDCCQWGRVECSDTTGRVIALDLSSKSNMNLPEWYLNASFFTPFQQLESLDLSWSHIAGFVENEGTERISELSNLKILDLSGNLFNSSILSSLARLSSLRLLNLDYNRLEGSIDVKEFDSRSNLEVLNMSFNKIDNLVVPQDYKGLRKLRSLDLSSVRGRDGSKLLQSMGSFPSLNTLYLRSNNFTGTVTNTQELENFTNLEYLTLDSSSLHISLLHSIASIFPSLKNLSMSHCEVNGVLRGQDFLNFKSLEHLNMNDPRIARNTSFLQIVGESMASLKYLSLSNSSLSTDNRILQGLCSLVHLQELYIDHNDLRGLEGLSRLSNLKILDLSFNLFNNSILSSLAHLSSLTSLDLYGNKLEGNIDIKELDSLRNLEELDIGGNKIDKFVVSKGLRNLKYLGMSDTGIKGIFDVQELDSLSNLEWLNMGSNEIDNLVVPQDYRGLRQLKRLDLSRVRIRDGSKLLQSMGSFPSLNTLYLMSNNFTNTATNTQELHNFTNLEYLTLDSSSLHICLLQRIASFTSLKYLSMSYCEVNGVLRGQGFLNFKNLEQLDMYFASIAPNTNFLQFIGESMASLKYLFLSYSTFGTNSSSILQGLCPLVHLQELYMIDNDLRGSLPWCLANMTSLESFDVSSNQLTGKISSSPLVQLTSIEDLKLSNNHFQIPISLEPLFNHSRLKSFWADNNEIKAEITESHSLTPKFQLQSLSLSSSCGDGVTFPKFLYHQHDLIYVDISHVTFSGEFPNWLLENNTKLESLLLINDSLTGPFHLPIHSHKRLVQLDASNNRFQGHIQEEIGDILPSLLSFNISMNVLDGSIPSSFGNLNFLLVLDLSNNQLTSEIPEHLAVGCINLELLALSNNSLEGRMFSTNFNLTKLKWLQLEDNHFTGEIPQSLSKCFSLEGLFLDDNNLSGKVPRWLGNLTKLQYIIMAANHLEGLIPMEFCQLDLLQVLDISDNNISGNLPSCFHPLFIKQVHLSKNMLHGQLKEGTFFNCSSLVILDLSYNRLNGSIPNWVDSLSQLTRLILAHNNLEGNVPVQLCRLNQLQLLDLSNNNLSGHIPPCFDNTALHESSNNNSSPDLYFVMQNVLMYSQKKILEIFEFTTKNITYTYQGRVISYLSGLDLSCNKLIGHIPPQIGNLTKIQTLNLSRNNLTGSIPSTFSNLKHIESLDLSYNTLNGKIPHQLVELNTLAVFTVAHNNLSGKLPELTGQFATFDESSYEGNPFLCGLPLPICNGNGPSRSVPEASTSNGEDDNLIDMDNFFITFATSYVIVIVGIIAVLYVNPYWRRRWFYLVDIWITSCYYFVVDNFIPTRFCN